MEISWKSTQRDTDLRSSTPLRLNQRQPTCSPARTTDRGASKPQQGWPRLRLRLTTQGALVTQKGQIWAATLRTPFRILPSLGLLGRGSSVAHSAGAEPQAIFVPSLPDGRWLGFPDIARYCRKAVQPR